jgi:cell division protein FtsB
MRVQKTISTLKDYSAQLARIFAFCFVCLYFSYQLVSGQNGIVNYFKEKAKLEVLQAKLAVVEEKREMLEEKTHKLYPESLDADLLDEQYRRTTGKIKPNERIYYYNN